jgi:hypothetical protein
MPFTVLVSALGAIVSAAIAMFGLHSWTALKVAPVIGASFGLLYAISELRRLDLPLSSTLEDYRSIAGIGDAPKLYFWSALRIGLIATCIELPAIMLGQQIALMLSAVGCVVVLCVTIVCSWRLTNLPVKLDVFQMAGGVGCLVIFGWMTFVIVTEARPWEQAETIPWIALTKMIFVINGVAATLSAVLACFALAILSSVSRLLAR